MYFWIEIILTGVAIAPPLKSPQGLLLEQQDFYISDQNGARVVNTR